MGIDAVPLPGRKAAVDHFIDIARERLVLVPKIGHALGGIVGIGADAQIETIRTKLAAGTHNAMTGAPAALGAPNDSIATSLARLGL